jgi:hypothetical protein
MIACSRPRLKWAMDLEASRPFHMGECTSRVGERVAEVEAGPVRRLRLASATLASFPHIKGVLCAVGASGVDLATSLSHLSLVLSPRSLSLHQQSPAKRFCLKSATCRGTTRSGPAAISNLTSMNRRARYGQGLSDGIRQDQLDGPRMNGYQPAIVSVAAPVCYFKSLRFSIVSF